MTSSSYIDSRKTNVASTETWRTIPSNIWQTKSNNLGSVLFVVLGSFSVFDFSKG